MEHPVAASRSEAALTPAQLSVRASGMTFAALAWGPADGPLALCLHGYPDTPWTWRHLGPALAERGWRVVAPFTRGYAPTDLAPDDDYSVGALARDAIALRGALGADDRAVLIGHDWGAVTAYALAGHSPGLFRRIVTLAVPPGPAVLAPLFRPRALALAPRQLRLSWYILFQQIPGLSERTLPRLIPWLWAHWSPGLDASEDLDHVRDALGAPERRRAALRYYRALARPWARSGAYRAEQRHLWRTPRQPVLYLHGRRDGCMLPDLGQRTRGAFPAGSRIEIVDDAGHFLQLERPERINGLIAQYIDS